MYLADIEEALIQQLGSGTLEIGMPMSQGQLKTFTIGRQFFGPRKDFDMTFADIEKEFVFWPSKRNLR